jgi:site-specific DNA-methyltransferase (adenine-specific)
MMKPYYQDDSCTIYHGDCLEVMKEIPDGSVDMVLADPPYGTTACKWDSIIPLEPMWEQLKRIIKPNGAIVLMAAQPFTSVLVASNIKSYKHCWVWEKSRSGSAITAKKCPVKIHEDILVFERNGATLNYYPILENGEPYSRKSRYNNENNHKFGISENVETTNTGTRYPKTIRFEKQNWSKQQQIHPTQKPVALMEYLIKTYTTQCDTVLDFTMGSGTTLEAAKQLGRKAIGIELEEKYCEIAAERLQQEYIQFG